MSLFNILQKKSRSLKPGLISWHEKDVQVIDLDSVMKKCDVILLVMNTFFI